MKFYALIHVAKNEVGHRNAQYHVEVGIERIPQCPSDAEVVLWCSAESDSHDEFYAELVKAIRKLTYDRFPKAEVERQVRKALRIPDD